MWSIIKWLFLIVIVGGAILWFTGTKIGGKTVKEWAQPVLEKPMVKEGLHDVRQIVGEGLKAAGEAVSEDVTDSEKKQLDNLVKQELEKGKPIAGAPGQQALSPAPQVNVAPQQPSQPRPGAAQMLQQTQPAAQLQQPQAPVASAPVIPTPEQPRIVPAPAAPAQAAPKGAQQNAGY